jgi:outer membrane receptor protein involved in Fe transport
LITATALRATAQPLPGTTEPPGTQPGADAAKTDALAIADGPRETALADADLDDMMAKIVVTDRTPESTLRKQSKELDQARDKELLPKFGASAYGVDREAIDALPQGKDTPLDKVLLQAPGVSYDSAVSNPDFHVRNEYANVQYRIDGIQLPDGVSGLGSILETGFIGNLTLLDGALPAQYGLRTAGVVDITTRNEFTPGGNFGLQAGSLGMLSPSAEFGGSLGQTQYFVTGRYTKSREGLENALPGPNPIHDDTTQGRLFGYGSTYLGDDARLTYVLGAYTASFQIPDLAGQVPLGDFGPAMLASTSLDERETDRFDFLILALQTRHGNLGTQLSVFTRYTSVDFQPDVDGDLAFNDVASNVTRRSLLDGTQFDAVYRWDEAHALRAGFALSAERTQVDDLATVLPVGPGGNPLAVPQTLNDANAKTGWNLGGYLQEEWTLRPGWLLNAGLRLDQLDQFVTARQISPRLALVYKPAEGTSLHAGFARYFTPPMQAQATPTNLALFQGTTQQPVIDLDAPVRPERASYFDLGADLCPLPGLDLGADAYYKRATDLLDDGQFGQAVVLTQFNYARGFSRGMEFKIDYRRQGLRTYANVSAEVTKAIDVVTNQYLFTDPAEFRFIEGHDIYTDDAQTLSASAGTSYRWNGMLASLDGIFGSGLRTGFANLQHVPGYDEWNIAIARNFEPFETADALTVRLSVVNVTDRSYLLRSGTGIGEFAPQYGPRRGFFVSLVQRF